MSAYNEILNAYKDEKSKEEIYLMYRNVQDKNEVSDEWNGFTLYHLAAKYGDDVAIKILLDSGARANVTDNRGETPLHALSEPEKGNPYRMSVHTPNDETIAKTVKILLDAKVSALRKNDAGATCYHLAASVGNFAFIKALADYGVKLDMTNESRKNIMHIVCTYAKQPQSMLQMAKERNDQDEITKQQKLVDDYFNIVKLAMDYGIDIEDKDDSDRTPMDYAKLYGINNLSYLLSGEYDESNAEQMELKIATGGKNLFEASRDGDEKAISALLKLGSDPNEVGTKEPFNGVTPLALACSYLNISCVQALLDGGADPNFKIGANGKTAMYYMMVYTPQRIREKEHRARFMSKIISLLVKKGLNVNDTVDDHSNTALHHACAMQYGVNRYGGSSPKELAVEDLISFGSDVNAKNLGGQTPLMYAVTGEGAIGESITLTLLENGANIADKDSDGNTPLMYAVFNPDESAAKAIINLMMDFGDVLSDTVNNDGNNALAFATQQNKEILVKLLLGM